MTRTGGEAVDQLAHALQAATLAVRSLAVQGGPAAAAEVSRFLRHPLAADAMALRRWDDLAKVPGAPTSSLDELLRRLA
ncbi:MAG: hypothetical protein M3408_13025 [Actinomycetota bacterium]|nr:hypothetical protein [Actinomycetota bacterium]